MQKIANRHTQRGFNLIETLVVMAIIILLASIVIPGLLGRKGQEPVLPKQEPKPAVPTIPEVPVKPDPEPEPVEPESTEEAEAAGKSEPSE